jgi:hypothetical protein
MKINIVLTLIALVLSSLLGYWVYSVADTDPRAAFAGFLSAVCLAIPLVLAFGVSYCTSASTTNIRALSCVLFVIMLILHFYYAVTGISMPNYLIICGILLCIYVAIVYGIIRSKQ